MFKNLAIILLIAAIGCGCAYGAAEGGLLVAGVPLLLLCVGLAFAINWLAWIPAALKESERFYDLTGSITYQAVIIVSLVFASQHHSLTIRQWLVSACTMVWTIRLGTFLVKRIRRDGKDGRFDAMKQVPTRFAIAWTLQGLWVTLTALAVLIINTQASPAPGLTWTDYLGLTIWGMGFAIEVVADEQKARFRADPANQGQFIDIGLWSRSRHPNYFGEILLWAGLAVVGAGVFEGRQWIGLISPVFVYILLTRISGVPLLAERGLAKWGDDPAYQAYLKRTRMLLPL